MTDRLALRLAVLRNEALRLLLAQALAAAEPLVRADLRRRIAAFPHAQEALRRRYGIDAATPVRRWSDDVQRDVDAWAAGRAGVRFASTSGSTARPKRLAFTPARLAAIRRGSWEAAVQAGAVHGVRRPTLFVLAALGRDASLSSLMLDDGRRTPYAQALVMPSKLLWEPGFAPLLERFGPTACRLWLLVLSDPGIVYSTNPSTLAVFLERLASDWEASTALVRAWLRAPRDLPAVAGEAARRVAAPGWERRARAVAEASAALPAGAVLDGLRCYACWDGGYVAPFLERIRRFLPAPRFEHVPMYSMSTETVETQAYYEGGRPAFLPLAPGVLYEFLPDGADDDASLLLPARALEPGRAYSLVVSDPYGLRRYQTDDLFLVARRVRGLPDLHFLRRRGLAYSFTGEKLTGEQVTAAFDALRAALPGLREGGVQLALLPSLAGGPHYRLALAWPGAVAERAAGDPGAVAPAAAAAALDRLLGEENAEWVTKRASGRLGPTRAVALPYDDLARALGGGRDAPASRRAWDTQFKLLPLYARTWEEAGLPEPAS